MRRVHDQIRAAIIDVVGTRAVGLEDIVGVVGERDQINRLLQWDASFAHLQDGIIHVPTLLDGTTWTVPVDAYDAAQHFVRTDPHLAPLTWWLVSADGVPLLDAEGREVGTLDTDGIWMDDVDTDVLKGPEGWLDELAGGWAKVVVTDGALQWLPCTSPPQATEAQVSAVRAGFEYAAGTVVFEKFEDEETVELTFASGDQPIHEAVLLDRAAFVDAPIPPLADLYEVAGLELRGSTLAAKGFDWDALERWRRHKDLKAIYGLTDREAELLVVVSGAFWTVLRGDPDALGTTEDERGAAAALLTGILDLGPLASAFWDECIDAREVPPSDVDRFVGVLAERFEGDLTVGLAWLRAKALDRAGETTDAIAVLDAAMATDCDHAPALVELAGFAADGGDAGRAYRLLRQAGVVESFHALGPDDELDDRHRLVAEVEEFALHRPRPAARRNDPCPCGSGRKYKACHLGRETHGLDDRAGWLYQKALRFLRERNPEAIGDIATAMTEDAPGSYRVRHELMELPFVADLALHEEDVFDAFLAARSGVLPDDEAMLAAQWSLVDRGVFEVRHAGDDWVELFDVGRGEAITVVRVRHDRVPQIGTLLVGRPLPVGDTYRAFSGFMPVSPSITKALLVAIDQRDAHELATIIGETFRPPLVRNTDGEDTILHTFRWRVADWAQVDAALVASGLRADESGDGQSWSLVRDTANQRQTIIASVRLDGDELVADVNSNERADEIEALIAEALPDATLIDHDERTFEEALDDFGPAMTAPSRDQTDPAIRQALEEFIAEHEARWLDESIPAFGGRTPREAVADPIGREQVVQLLAQFPVPGPDEPGMMNPDRLRAALGLSTQSRLQ